MALTTLAVLICVPGCAAAAHLGALAVASLFYVEHDPASRNSLRLLILVPAHEEERMIGRCVRAINAHRRARDLVLVVADHCTDATGSIARRLGAVVLERGGADPPGRAAARQAGLEHARNLDWDAVVMLDADSVVAPGFFDCCERALGTGVQAAQARSESEPGPTLASEASLAAFTLQGITLPRGRDRLRASVRLRGTGMVLRRPIALAHRFRAPASEDLVFTLDLLLAGVRCRHVDGARLRSHGASTWDAFGGQKVRYEAGRMAAARAYLPRLLSRAIRQRDRAALEAAWFLATPPFALAALSLVIALGLAGVAGSWSVAAASGAGLMVLALVIVTGLIQGRAGVRTWFALLAAPWYLCWKAVVQLRALASVIRRDELYPPTARV